MEKPFLILSLLMLALNIVHVSSQVEAKALNIACGTAGSFIDPYGNQWVGDDQFMGYGSTAILPFPSPDAPYLTTVRYFPPGSMNCYVIGGMTLGATIKVVAIFVYGNYENWPVPVPPSFLLQIEGSAWTSVQTTMGLVELTSTYVTEASTISVCLNPDSTGRVPFISAIRILEVVA